MPLVRRDASTPKPAAPKGDLLQQLADADANIRWSAARDLGGDPGKVDALAAALLREPEPRVREAILTALARAGTPQAVDAVLGQVRSDDAGLRTGALDAMRAMPAAVWPRLPQMLDDSDSDVRLLVCELAREAPPAEAQTLLCDLLDRETEVNVCAAAVEVLTEVGDAGCLPALERCARRFETEGFLGFAIAAAKDQVSAGAKEPRG